MSLAFKPIEMSLATLDHEFVDLYADGALGLHKEAGDAAGPAWQMFYHQSVVTDWQLFMVSAGMENGEFWGYFNGAHAPIHPSAAAQRPLPQQGQLTVAVCRERCRWLHHVPQSGPLTGNRIRFRAV